MEVKPKLKERKKERKKGRKKEKRKITKAHNLNLFAISRKSSNCSCPLKAV